MSVIGSAARQDDILATALSKCWKRLMPFMFIFYFVAFIDRVFFISMTGRGRRDS